MSKLLLLYFYLFSVSAYAVPAVVDYIVDGDTFAGVVKLQGETDITVRVRIRNIDTPEIKGQCESEVRAAYRAKDRLGQLLPVGAVVDLQNIKDDKYLGRIDANVFYDGRDVGDVLVREQLARSYDGGRRGSWCD
jgi:endonuclease YncB( thermonuclease family)